MRMLIIPMTALALLACNKQPNPNDLNAANATLENVAMGNDVANAGAPANGMMAPAAAALTSSTYEFVQHSRAIQESIDANGNYIATAGKEHMDHGTAAVKDGKFCFTSAMTKDGEMCWTDPKLEIGQMGKTTSDKGETLNIKRVAYVPKTM